MALNCDASRIRRVIVGLGIALVVVALGRIAISVSARFEVVAAANGYDAVSKFEEKGDPFDVIILDQAMPGLTGLETYHRLQDQGVTRPAIIMSGFSEKHLGEELENLTFLPKPCSRDALVDAIAGATGLPR